MCDVFSFLFKHIAEFPFSEVNFYSEETYAINMRQQVFDAVIFQIAGEFSEDEYEDLLLSRYFVGCGTKVESNPSVCSLSGSGSCLPFT